MAKNKVLALTRVGTAAGFFNPAAYVQIGFAAAPTGFEHACFLIRIVNDTDQDVDISYDGVTDNDYLRTGETLQLQAQTNSPHNTNAALFPIGFKVYVKAAVGMGTIFLTGYYLDQN